MKESPWLMLACAAFGAAIGVLIGADLQKCDQKAMAAAKDSSIPAWVVILEKTNGTIEIRSNVRRILKEMYDTPPYP